MNRFLITWVFFLPLGVFAQDVVLPALQNKFMVVKN